MKTLQLHSWCFSCFNFSWRSFSFSVGWENSPTLSYLINVLGKNSKMHSGHFVNKADFWVSWKTDILSIKSTKCQHCGAPLCVGPEGNWVCVYPDGRVPLPVLRRLLVVSFLRFGLEWLVLLLWHFHHSVLWLLQLSPLLGRAFPSPTHLQTADKTWIYNKIDAVNLTSSSFHNLFCHLHPLDPSDSSSSIIWGIHSGPLLLGQAVFIIWLLKHK